MLDKYANWPTPWDISPVRPLYGAQNSIEDEVLSDLEKAGDDKLLKYEVLDSYAAYYQKCYRAQVSQAISHEAGRTIVKMFGPFLNELMPEIRFFHHAARGQQGQEI
jgi:hypothetical protein